MPSRKLCGFSLVCGGGLLTFTYESSGQGLSSTPSAFTLKCNFKVRMWT